MQTDGLRPPLIAPTVRPAHGHPLIIQMTNNPTEFPNMSDNAKGPEDKFCSECSGIIRAKAEICPLCGVRQAPTPGSRTASAPNGKSKIAAGLFALLLGDFGAHKFYLGKPGLGVLYLIFFWTWIPGLIGLIEGIILISMGDEEFIQKYGDV